VPEHTGRGLRLSDPDEVLRAPELKEAGEPVQVFKVAPVDIGQLWNVCGCGWESEER
jgi:hypothetical protein